MVALTRPAKLGQFCHCSMSARTSTNDDWQIQNLNNPAATIVKQICSDKIFDR